MSLNGAIIIDKSAGVTSHDVVDSVRNIFNTRAVGHAGTLDPIATGILICLIGEGTKLSQYVMTEEKSYRVGVKFGVKTDSGDISGKVIGEKGAIDLTSDLLISKIKTLVGTISLKVPKYSAVKVQGKKLYEYARKNEDVELPIKDMVIQDARLVEFSNDKAIIDLDCEKGTYVRSWVEKLGEILHCDATVESLRRTKSGSFELGQSVTLSDLEKLDMGNQQVKLIPLVDVLGGWPALRVTGRDQGLVINGQIPKGVYSQILNAKLRDKGVRLLDENGLLLALAVSDPSKGVKLARVFNH